MSAIVTIIIIGFVTYFIYQFFRAKNPEVVIEKYEASASFLYQQIFDDPTEKSGNILKIGTEEEKKAIEEMKVKYIRLHEKFKHDSKMRVKIAKDWSDYVFSIHSLYGARKILSVNMEDNAWDEFGKRSEEPKIQKEEIEKRFNKLLKDK